MRLVAVTGASMWPALKSGDVVIVEAKREFRPGDMVFFAVEGLPTVHRWLGPGICKGDREFNSDEVLRHTALESVTGVIPRHRLRTGGQVRASSVCGNGLFSTAQRTQAALSLWQLRMSNRLFRRWLCRLLLIANGWLMRLFIYLHPGERSYVMSDRS